MTLKAFGEGFSDPRSAVPAEQQSDMSTCMHTRSGDRAADRNDWWGETWKWGGGLEKKQKKNTWILKYCEIEVKG